LATRIRAHLAPPSVLCIISFEVASHSRLAEPAAMVRTSCHGKEPGFGVARMLRTVAMVRHDRPAFVVTMSTLGLLPPAPEPLQTSHHRFGPAFVIPA